VEKADAGARYHAVAEEGVRACEIAEVIGRGLRVPVAALASKEATGHFGWLGMFAGFDMPASSVRHAGSARRSSDRTGTADRP
jgi:hypothetical protein